MGRIGLLDYNTHIEIERRLAAMGRWSDVKQRDRDVMNDSSRGQVTLFPSLAQTTRTPTEIKTHGEMDSVPPVLPPRGG